MEPTKIAIITDSCADLTPQQIKENHIYVVPLRVECLDGDYRDGIDITSEDVYRRLRAGELPKTSLPLGQDVTSVITQAARDGYDGAIAIMLSSGLSGTCNLMRIAGEEASEEGFPLRVYDSLNGSLGYGMTILQLAEDLRGGMGWEEATEVRVPQLLKGAHPFFSVDTLEYLMKGGRIGRVTATAGTLLKIKPILTFFEDGQLNSVAKVRGKAQVINKLVDLVVEACGDHKKYNLATAHGGDPENMEILKEKLIAALPDYDHIWSGIIDSTLSVYIGDGILGAAVQILD